MLALQDVSGRPLAGAAPHWWRRAAAALGEWHALGSDLLAQAPPGGPPEWAAVREAVSQQVADVERLCPDLAPASGVFARALAAVWARHERDAPTGGPVFAHGDPVPGNLLVADEPPHRVTLLDWEAAGPQAAGRDLAALACHLPAAQRDAALAAYLDARAASAAPPPDALAADFAVAARARLAAELAGILLAERVRGPAAAENPAAAALARRLGELDAHPPA